MFVCLFVCLNVQLIWRRHHITGEEPQILTFAQHSWPLSSEGSLACHTSYDIMVISKDPWHSCFNVLGLSRLGFKHPTFRAFKVNALTDCATAAVSNISKQKLIKIICQKKKICQFDLWLPRLFEWPWPISVADL